MNDKTPATTETRAVVPFRDQLAQQAGQFSAVLPSHIPVERFQRVVMTAVQNNPKLLEADRRSLWNSAMRAAQDGLLPDGREGAMVLFKNVVQWMPMVAGIRKKVRQSGEIATWDAYVVHAKDAFEFELGDDPFIKHKPSMDADPGKVIAAYSVATLKSGEKSREVMTVAQIEKVRAVSRAKDNGPWVSWYEEMCRKTVIRRHSKSLPMSTDIDEIIRRDEADDAAADRALVPPPAPTAAAHVAHDPATGEIVEETIWADANEAAPDKTGNASPGASLQEAPSSPTPAQDGASANPPAAPVEATGAPAPRAITNWTEAECRRHGVAAFEKGMMRTAAVHPKLRVDGQEQRQAWILDGYDEAAETAAKLAD